MPSHYLNQCWLIVNCTLRNKLQWIFFIKMQNFSFTKMHLNISSVKWWLFCPGEIWWCHQMETFLRNWPFVRVIHRSTVNSSQKDQWCGALMFSLLCLWINNWVNNHEDGDLWCYHAHYDVIVMDEVRSYRISFDRNYISARPIHTRNENFVISVPIDILGNQ